MTLRRCIGISFVFGVGMGAVACEAVGSVGHAVLDVSDVSSSSSGDPNEWHEASSEGSSEGSSGGEDRTMPATTDRDPSSGGSNDTGWASSEAGDETSTTDEAGSDEIGKLQFDLGSGTGDEDCCAPTDAPGCADAMIESCVCELDVYCCEESWDEVCANTAQESGCSPCGGVGRPPQLDCCSANMVEGCIDPEVQDCVCAIDPYCCAQAWDQACVDMVDELGCGACQMDATGG
jgi:hypothetical protein